MKLESIGIIFGILSTICAGIYFIVDLINKYQIKKRNKVHGIWVNAGEGSFDVSETHDLKLELEIDIEDGKINGVLKSISISGESISPLCSITGYIKFNSANIKIWHYRNGEAILFGEAYIAIKKKNLFWKIKKDIANFFPSQTLLFKEKV